MKLFNATTIASVVVGVIIAGFVMYLAASNDIPLITDARKGFDA